MKILVVNCGSSSLKYQLIDMDTEKTLGKGLVERIGLDPDMPDHNKAIKKAFQNLHDEKVIEDISEIDAVGHRFVNGSEKYINPTFVTPETLKGFEDIIVYAPLHNPAHIAGMKACVELMPNTPQVSIFDTEFHQTMPPEEHIYAIPYRYYEDFKIRRYGAHGTSHKYVSIKASEYMNKKDLNIITCHLGNGSSISAVKNGKCIATSMGFTPLAGVAMGTRSGDIDPAVLGFICERENITAAEMVTMLNKKSGVLGISGLSSDFRDLGDAAKEGNEKAKLAIDIFVHSVKKYIGSYAAILNGLDVLVFTAGIGENSSDLRAQICSNLEFLGIEIDSDKNNTRGTMEINKAGAKVKVLVIPTNEELMIAKETMEMVKHN